MDTPPPATDELRDEPPGEGTAPMQVPAALSRVPSKRWFYAREAYFREAWLDLGELWGEAREEHLRRLTFVLFKPDGVVARSVRRGVDALGALGFRAVLWRALRFDRVSLRELWRYELNRATPERLAAIDLLLPSTESLLLVLEDVAQEAGGRSAAERLRLAKGPSRVELRDPAHLRTRMRAGTGLLNLIHTPDEPADVVRELGVLLDTDARRGVARALARRPWPEADVAAAEARVYSGAPEHDLDLGGVLDRFAAACASASAGSADLDLVAGALAEARAGRRVEWRQVLAAADRAALVLDPWDRIVFAARATVSDLPGVLPLIDDVDKHARQR